MPDKPSLQELAKLDRRTIDPGLLRDEGGWPDSAGACLYASVVAVVLLRRFGGVRENAAAAFVHDNADLLARDRQEGFEKTHWVTFDGQRLLDLPEDAAPEWLEAAKELALAVLAHQPEHKSGYVEEYKRTQAKQFATAQKVCRQFLERFKLISTNPYERATRAAELLREAQALGLNLTEPDGSAVRTSA